MYNHESRPIDYVLFPKVNSAMFNNFGCKGCGLGHDHGRDVAYVIITITIMVIIMIVLLKKNTSCH